MSLANAEHLLFCAALKQDGEVLSAQNEVLNPVTPTKIGFESNLKALFVSYCDANFEG